MSISYAHLYHLCTNSYAAHKALEDYYEDMPKKVDALAEHYLSNNSSVIFEFFSPISGVSAQSYFESLADYIQSSKESKLIPEEYMSELDEVHNCIKSLLYRLKNLSSDRKRFTMSKEFSDHKVKSNKLDKAVDNLTEVITDFYRKFKKSPIKEIKDPTDKRKVRQYVKDNLNDTDNFTDLMSGIMDSISTTTGTFLFR
jgi:DNA-binding ferritin-like protein